jgi:hypothetical protein
MTNMPLDCGNSLKTIHPSLSLKYHSRGRTQLNVWRVRSERRRLVEVIVNLTQRVAQSTEAASLTELLALGTCTIG